MDEIIWQIKAEDKEHIVRYTVGPENSEVSVDGNIVDSKDSSYMGVLMEKSFTIDSKSARIQRLRLLSEDWILFYEGMTYSPLEKAGEIVNSEGAGNGKD